MVNRVTGLGGSGLDTEALVKQMMALSQSRYDNIMKKKTETEWKKQLYDDIYAQLKTFDDQIFKATLSNFNAPKTTSITDESMASVSASANAANVSHTLKVISLAKGATMTSSDRINLDTSKTTLKDQLGLTFSGSAELILKDAAGNDTGKRITIDDSTQSMSDIVKQINESGLGLKATYDTNLGRLFINSTNMGEATGFTIEAGTNGTAVMDALKLGNGTGKAEAKGSDAEIVFDETTFKQDKNDFTLAGLTFSLKSADPLKEAMISVKSDNTKLVENVKNLVQSYNNLLELINGKTTEKYYRDYGPITDEQRKEMSDKEIELWEEKAKSGLLRNDSILTGLASKMRTAMYSSYNVDGKFKTMSSIGISTVSYQDKGKLTIDENKLMKALEEDPDAVGKLFNGGLVDSLRDDIKKTTAQMEKKSGSGILYDTQSSWAKEISKYSDQMETLAAKMVREENRYYVQFASMEKLLSSMNSSSSYLTSMFGQ